MQSKPTRTKFSEISTTCPIIIKGKLEILNTRYQNKILVQNKIMINNTQ